MNQHALFKHLFSKVKIPDSPINKIFSEYKRKNNISEQNNSLYSLFFKNKSTSKELHKSENLIKNSNLKISKILKNNSIKLKIKTKGTKMNSLDNKSQNKYSTNTTQTAFIIEKPKKTKQILVNSFRNKSHPLNIKKKYIKKKKIWLSSYLSKNNNFDLYKNKNNKNNICINSSINKTISNAIVDNNDDLIREIKFQTVNNFNNKYKLKYKVKFPKMHSKISDIFSLLKIYKFEEEKKIDAILNLTNEKLKKKERTRNKQISFNEKDFIKNISLFEKDFNIKNKLKDNKKYVSIHTLDLLKDNNIMNS